MAEDKEQFPQGVNAYVGLCALAQQDAESAEMLDVLNRAMDETGVRPEAREIIGNFVLRLSRAAEIRDGMIINTEVMPGLDRIVDTVQRFHALMNKLS